jgi:hypothetical protein
MYALGYITVPVLGFVALFVLPFLLGYWLSDRPMTLFEYWQDGILTALLLCLLGGGAVGLAFLCWHFLLLMIRPLLGLLGFGLVLGVPYAIGRTLLGEGGSSASCWCHGALYFVPGVLGSVAVMGAYKVLVSEKEGNNQNWQWVGFFTLAAFLAVLSFVLWGWVWCLLVIAAAAALALFGYLSGEAG